MKRKQTSTAAEAVKLSAGRPFTWNKAWTLHLMILPGLLALLIFSYLPMAGLVIAFQDFKPWLGVAGSQWVGLDNFRMMFERPDSIQVIWNTLIISSAKITAAPLSSIGFALLLNEVRMMFFKRAVQTLVYLPHFLSWVILGGILIEVLSNAGLVNRALQWIFGVDNIPFLMNGNWFRFTVVVSDVWKEFGFGAIVFLAALTSINPSLYEAAEIDGASRWRQTLVITLPGIMPIIVLMFTLSLGNVLNAGFDQIFNMYNSLVYDKADIIDTFVYRTGILGGGMGFATAVGMFKSVVGLILILLSYRLAYKIADYRIF